MAQLDPNIILQARQPQIESPMNNLAKLMQVQGLQQQNQLGQLKMDEHRVAGERRNKLASLLSGQYETPEARESALLSGGFMDEATKLGTDRRANQKSDLEIDTSRQKLATERYTTFKKTLGALESRPDLSKDLVTQVGQELVSAGIIPAEMYRASIANMPDDPNALRQRLREGVAAQMTPEQMFTVFAPKPEKIDSGQTIGFRDTNPNSPTYGQNTGGAPVQKQMTPGEVASNRVAQGNLAVSQSRLNFDKQQGPAGKPPAGYRWTPDGSLEPIPGGPGAQRAAEVGFKQGERNDAKDAKRAAISAQIAVVDKALTHPGRETSTGLSGSIDPRNFVPGTDAADFRAVLDQIGGTAFLQAFESLKGGGQITEVEGKKATDAIARLSRAQSDKEFKKSLEDLREVMVKGQSRLGGEAPAPAPAAGSNIDALLEKYK